MRQSTVSKLCNRCSEEKPLELFAKGSKYKDGRRNICKKCHSEYMVQWYVDNPDKYEIKKKVYRPNWSRHKLSEERYMDLMNLHGGNCHVCREREAVNIDHDHACCFGSFSCGSCVRGVLCNQCNTAIGLLRDNKDIVRGMLDYLS